MNNIRIFVAIIIAIFTSFASMSAVDTDDPVVMTVGPKKVRLSELEYLYNKNSKLNPAISNIDDYAQMYADYKLKVLDAMSMGLDTTASFREEYNSYRKLLSDSLIRDRAIDDSLHKAAYGHYFANVDVAQILLPAGTSSEQADSIARAASVGAPFAELVRRFSVDPSAGVNDGRLGFIRAGQYPYYFEDVVYNLAVGGVSHPFASPEGIRIVKVFGRRKDRGTVKVSRIYKTTRGLDHAEMTKKKAEIDSLHTLLDHGADFHRLAATNTDAVAERENAGSLGWLTGDEMSKEFEDVAFALTPGSVSEVVRTPDGYNIIFCDEKKETPSYDEVKAEIDRVMRIDGRDTIARAKYLDDYQKSHRMYGASREDVYEAALSTIYDDMPEYRNLIDEYRDGMLLYEVSKMKLWDPASDDDSALEMYFEQNKDRYNWGELHYKGHLVMATSDSIAREAAKWLGSMRLLPSSDVLSRELRRKFGPEVRIEQVVASKGFNPIIDYIAFGGPRPEPQGKWKAFEAVDGRVIDRPEQMSDVRAQVANDYQMEAEDRWVNSLRERYPVRIYPKELHRISRTVEIDQ